MQPLDRVNAYSRRCAATMRAITLQQRLENKGQLSRMRALREENHVLRRRARLEGVQGIDE
jgi:hypothetical protein